MNELTYSFIGSLRAWLRENEAVLLSHNIKADMSPYTLHSGVPAHLQLAMSDIKFVDWRLADKDPDYQVEWSHYEYATIKEMWNELDTLKARLIAADRAEL